MNTSGKPTCLFQNRPTNPSDGKEQSIYSTALVTANETDTARPEQIHFGRFMTAAAFHTLTSRPAPREHHSLPTLEKNIDICIQISSGMTVSSMFLSFGCPAVCNTTCFEWIIAQKYQRLMWTFARISISASITIHISRHALNAVQSDWRLIPSFLWRSDIVISRDFFANIYDFVDSEFLSACKQELCLQALLPLHISRAHVYHFDVFPFFVY